MIILQELQFVWNVKYVSQRIRRYYIYGFHRLSEYYITRMRYYNEDLQMVLRLLFQHLELFQIFK